MVGTGWVISSVCLVLCLLAGCKPGSFPAGYYLDTDEKLYSYEGGSLKQYSVQGNEVLAEGKAIFKTMNQTALTAFDLCRIQNHVVIAALIAKKDRRYLAVYDTDEGRYLAVKDMTAYHPWKLRLCDADGDGIVEVCLGVRKQSPLHQVMAKRLFVYTCTDGTLRPKWLGSRLARPFTDFEFVKRPEGTFLLALEVDGKGRNTLNRYQWDSFGFTKCQEYSAALPRDAGLVRGYPRDGKRRCILVTRSASVLMDIPVE